ncbi:MAG: hypothetical protein EXS00_02340 [Phycisphaerales bacterium]|nr:hypothetical protein [Phycisphaerales bacterium]
MPERLLQLFRSQDPLGVALELAVIWIGVFLSLRFMERTRGAGVFKGVIVAAALLLLALRFLGAFSESFSRLRYLSEGLLGVSALLMVVVFQSEIRQGMVRLGQTLSIHGRKQQGEAEADAVAAAVRTLSRAQIGALIVIERSVPLVDLAANGIALDARLDSRLLEAIFWPSNPLHDLAVVVREGRIASANVELPLAETGSLGAELGSRHRAALGATVDTDCLVVVVSEQTGSVRFAQEGELSTPVSLELFRDEFLDRISRGADHSREVNPHVVARIGPATEVAGDDRGQSGRAAQ